MVITTQLWCYNQKKSINYYVKHTLAQKCLQFNITKVINTYPNIYPNHLILFRML